MSTSHWLNQKASAKEVDVVIVGAGIAGCSAAYWLNKKDPSLKVAIVEKSRLAFGATGRNAGFITCGSVEHFNRLVETHGEEQALKIWNFSEVNLQLLKQEVVQGEAASLEFEEKGSFSLASTASELEELRKSAEIMRRNQIPVDELTGAEITQRLGAENFAGGIHYLSDASIHPVKLCQKILKRCPEVEFFEQTEVYGVDREGEKRQVLTDRETFSCDLVIFATNGYSDTMDEYFRGKIFPTRGQILTLQPVSQRVMEGPCYANFVLDYFRQLPSGELLIGGFRQLEKTTEVGYSDHVTEKIQTALHDFIQKYLPRFKDLSVVHRWAGVMGFSVDGQPLVGALPKDPQTYFSAGFTAHGLGLAFHAGKCLADAIHGEEIPDFLSAKRF